MDNNLEQITKKVYRYASIKFEIKDLNKELKEIENSLPMNVKNTLKEIE